MKKDHDLFSETITHQMELLKKHIEIIKNNAQNEYEII